MSTTQRCWSEADVIGLPVTLDLLTAAGILGVGRSRAYELARSGELPTLRLGTRYRVTRRALLGLLGISGSEMSEAGLSQPAAATTPTNHQTDLTKDGRPMMHQTCRRCTAGNPAVPPIPPQGPARVRWLDQVDSAIAADVLAAAGRLAAEGWSPAAVEWVLGTYGGWLTSRVLAAVDGARLELAWQSAA